jgi:NlpC/P60 family putative phage cell wall peptidase
MDYFINSTKQEILRQAAAEWIGTPFRAHTQVPQGGVDCVHLIAALMREAGVEHDFQPPDYSLDWGRHAATSPLLDYLREEPNLRELAACESPLAGDILTFRIGAVEHHVGILLRSQSFIHATQRLGTVLSQLTGAWRDRLSISFRVYIK